LTAENLALPPSQKRIIAVHYNYMTGRSKETNNMFIRSNTQKTTERVVTYSTKDYCQHYLLVSDSRSCPKTLQDGYYLAS